MKSSTKIGASIVLIIILTIGALLVQNWATTYVEPIHLTAEQIDQMLSALPPQFRQPIEGQAERQRFLSQLQDGLIFGAEARRLGLLNRPDLAYRMGLHRDSLLSAIFKQKYPDVDIQPEEIDVYFRNHSDDLATLARYDPQFRGRSVDQQTRKVLGELRIAAERARAEGLDKDPGVSLALQYIPYAALQQTLLSEVQRKTTVSDDEIQARYRQHPEEIEEVRARHILFRTRPPASGQSGDAAETLDAEAMRRQAEDVLQRIRQGEDFAELAREYSEDPGSASRGGDLGYFPRGRMTAKFEEAAFSLNPGGVSDLVETPFGFHVIKVEDRRVPPLDDSLRGILRNRLRQRKLEQIRRRYEELITVEGAIAGSDRATTPPRS